MKKVYVGLEGSGKSLLMARELRRVVRRNEYWSKATGVPRDIVTTTPFSESIKQRVEAYGGKYKVIGFVGELEGLKDSDVFIDELGAYFDSRNFADLPLSLRLWLAQAQKLGTYMYGTAQDFAQVDVAFRRLCTHVYETRKIVGSLRPANSVPRNKYMPYWAFFLRWEMNAQSFDGNQQDMVTTSILPTPFFLRKKDYSLYDTNARVTNRGVIPMEHVVKKCKTCGKEHVAHR